jgi:MFS family permease
MLCSCELRHTVSPSYAWSLSHSTIMTHNVIWFQFSAAWGMGLIIGPALGGYLAQVLNNTWLVLILHLKDRICYLFVGPPNVIFTFKFVMQITFMWMYSIGMSNHSNWILRLMCMFGSMMKKYWFWLKFFCKIHFS